MRCILSVCTVIMALGASATIFAAEPLAGADVATAVTAGAANLPLPRPGQWVEYLVSYPADPLENSLLPAPPAGASTPDGRDETTTTESAFFIEPSFEPPVIWRSVPLRLEIRSVTPAECAVRMHFGSMARDAVIPLVRQEGEPIPYDDPQPDDSFGGHVVGDTSVSVVVTRRDAPGLGFVRMSSPDLPFGLARFATDTVDIALVGMGEGEPPPFPLPYPTALDPAPGKLYRGEE